MLHDSMTHEGRLLLGYMNWTRVVDIINLEYWTVLQANQGSSNPQGLTEYKLHR